MSRTPPPDPLQRDQQALADLVQPVASDRWQSILLGLAAILLSTVTLTECLLDPPRLPLALGELESSYQKGGLLAANRELLASLDEFESGLEERSLVAHTVAPWIQWIQTLRLGVGDHQVRLGRDDWLFFRPAVEFATGPGFLEPDVIARRRAAGDSWQDPIAADPRPAILDFHRELTARGIELVLLPVPTKAQVDPQRLSRHIAAEQAPLANPSMPRLLTELAAAGVRVVDPTSVLVAARADGEPQFLARDTHWTPAAVERTAELLSRELTDLELARPRSTGWTRSPALASHAGDLVEMLGLPEGRSPWRPDQVVLHSVRDPSGRPWQPDAEAEILLLGDSFSNVYSTPDLGWGVGAGLAEQLSWQWQRPVDRIAVNAGGASGARQRLARELAQGRDRLATKRVVIWEVSNRELTSGDWEVVPLPHAPPRSGTGSDETLPRRPLGDGLVVWESNRTGNWRIFVRPLEGGAPRQLSPDEPGRQHCCPHFSPDGTRVAYLSRLDGASEYPKVERPGELRILSLRDGTERTVAPARTYGWGNRAVVWRDDSTLIFVDGEGRTAELDLATQEERLLVASPRAALGWLLDPSLAFATNAAPSFSPYQPEGLAVAERSGLGGCEPYFSSDGRWGYWNAGPGGPIQRIDPRTRSISPLILRDDPRLPIGWRYLYFVMTSRDDRAMAWGASNGDHDHFAADYEIFVAPIDPETLELTGAPSRITHHPATDRYPDVFRQPLELGYHALEAPHTLRLGLDTGVAQSWRLDGREVATGPTFEHLFERPGSHHLVAVTPEGHSVEGLVIVSPRQAPTIEEARLRDRGTALRVRFDEPMQTVPTAGVDTDPPGTVVDWRLEDGGRTLHAALSREVREDLRLRLRGFTDQAQVPNPLAADWIELLPASWPVTERDLLFAWENERAPNLVFDSALGADRSSTLITSGRAYPNRDHALVLDGGWAQASDEDSAQIAGRLDATLEVALEVLLTPSSTRASNSDRPRRLLALAPRRGRALLEVSQRSDRLEATFLTSEQRDPTPIVLGPVRAGTTHHLVLSFTGATLTVTLDGARQRLERQPTGTLGPWRAKNPRLLLGSAEEESSWRGTIEGLALWGRALDEEGHQEAWERARRRLSSRPQIKSRQVAARLLRRSAIPSLEEISPYRSGLVAFEWQPESPVGAAPITVVHWALLDGDRQPVTELAVGDLATLELEPFGAQVQLEPFYLSDRSANATPGSWFAVGLRTP